MYRNVFLHQDLTRKNLLLTWMHADSVKTMETFVEKQFSHDPSMHSKFLPTTSGSSFEFPPGHKVLILKNYNTKHSHLHLRSHLQEILETCQIKEFPSAQGSKRKSRILSTEVVEVHCICQMPDDGCKMVCCDRCNKWFHAACVDYCDDIKLWYCVECSKFKEWNL